MARILLVDEEGRCPPSIVDGLRRKHMVNVVATREGALDHLKSDIRWDVVILELSADAAWETLDAVRNAIMTRTPKPAILCVSVVKCAPEVRLEVERRGCRFLVIHGQ